MSWLRFKMYSIVFVAGMATLGVELTASRLLGNVFGTSNIVWANVIGLILLYLTVGNYWGGRWADHAPRLTLFLQIILWAAFLSALIPLVGHPIIRTAANAFAQFEAALALGSFVAILVLFALPITLLGMVSPFAIRLSVQEISSAGSVAGRIYAISTVGSLVGTFLPVLLLVPTLGTTATFIFFGGLLFAPSFFVLWQENRKLALRYVWMPLSILVLWAAAPTGLLRDPYGQNTLLYARDSAYNYIQVQEAPDGTRYLYLNEGQGIHSQWHPEQIVFNRTWDYFLVAPYFHATFVPERMERLLIVGLAAGTIAHQYHAVYGDVPMDGIEIDPEIIRVAKQFFGMNANTLPSLNAIAGDGRYMLRTLPYRYTVIGVDAYRPPYIPWHLTTREFFQALRDKLTDEGVVVVNVGRTHTDRRLVEALTNTLLTVFASVHTMDVPNSFNTILVATQTKTDATALARHQAALHDTAPLLANVLRLAQETLVPTVRSDLLFTDDHAPVELLVDSIVMNFLFSGGTEILR